jgi:hypothetical protein
MTDDHFKLLTDVVSLLANILTIVTAALALWVGFKKGPALSAAMKLLVNYSYQTTLHELRDKLERLNEYNARDDGHKDQIINILHELQGQIAGNTRVKKAMPIDALDSLEKLLNPKSLTEPRKRALVSQIREVLKNMNIENIDDFRGLSE